MNSKHFISAALSFAVITFLVIRFSDTNDKVISATIIENPVTPSGNVTAGSNSTQMIAAAQTAQAPVLHEKKKDFRYLQDRLAAMQERRPNMSFEPEQVAAAIERDVAWVPLKEIPKELPLKPEEFTDGREFISFDSLKIETLMPGDRIRIPVKALSKEYDVTIDTVEKHDYNSISWNGHIEGGDGRNYNATFTRGANLTVGGMETPDGQYELQATGDKGWIASANLLFRNHVDPIDPNTVVPGSVPVQPHDHSTHSHAH